MLLNLRMIRIMLLTYVKIPIDFEIPIGSEFICNCELAIDTTDDYFLTFKMSNPTRIAIELGWVDEQFIFQLK